MRRFHLFEFEDQKWFPHFIRTCMVDYLRFMINTFDIYKPSFKILGELIKRTGERKIVELCAGGGGAVERISEVLGAQVESITLTDLYPNEDAFTFLSDKNPKIKFSLESVDVKNVPASYHGIRTIYSALHHFKPDDVKKILQNAVDSNSPIAIFEAAERNPFHMLAILFSTYLSFLIFTLFIKPIKLGRLFFTYIIPAIPLFTTFDGIVSVLRMYKPNELLALAKETDGKNYIWKSGIETDGLRRVTFLTGQPVK